MRNIWEIYTYICIYQKLQIKKKSLKNKNIIKKYMLYIFLIKLN